MSYKVKFEVEGYQCLRCGHKWVPRIKTVEEPTICPDCKSPYWNKVRRANVIPREVSETMKRHRKVRKRG